MEDGTNWPARNRHAVALAEEIVARVPSVEQLRFTNSGSEATMVAVEIARVATGRRMVLMARYGYHGSAPHFECGTFGHEGPETLLATLRRAACVRGGAGRAGRRGGRGDPGAGDGLGGLVAASPSSWPVQQAAAKAAGAAVRPGRGHHAAAVHRRRAGACSASRPDLTAMGKIIGGGFPVGAVGGREELLALCDPARPRLFHSGTFNGNPVTTAAGLVSLQHLTAETDRRDGRPCRGPRGRAGQGGRRGRCCR